MPNKKMDIYYGYCCRLWPLAFFQPLGSCGICKKVPEFAGTTLEEAKTWVLVNKIY